MPAHQSVEELARANGFSSSVSLLAASRRVVMHDGHEHFIALCPDGQELLWAEDDVTDLNVDRSGTGSVAQHPELRKDC